MQRRPSTAGTNGAVDGIEEVPRGMAVPRWTAPRVTHRLPCLLSFCRARVVSDTLRHETCPPLLTTPKPEEPED